MHAAIIGTKRYSNIYLVLCRTWPRFMQPFGHKLVPYYSNNECKIYLYHSFSQHVTYDNIFYALNRYTHVYH